MGDFGPYVIDLTIAQSIAMVMLLRDFWPSAYVFVCDNLLLWDFEPL
jgi:hypothetical protein